MFNNSRQQQSLIFKPKVRSTIVSLKHLLMGLLFATLLVSGCSAASADEISVSGNSSKAQSSVLRKANWIHGSSDCAANADGVIDVYRHNPTTFILRQNKCVTFEAPFIYVLVGEEKVLVLDTGAIEDLEGFSLYQEIRAMIGEENHQKEMLVIHSHGHSDHRAGDEYFIGQPGVTVVGASAKEMKTFFDFERWPETLKDMDLGNRTLTVIPTPGHHDGAIAIYDHETKWLLTGDTLYPGYIYIKEWHEYKSSISRLVEFARNNEIKAVMGTHIEMKNQAQQYYPIGSTYQPNEATLDLAVDDLLLLHSELENADDAQTLIFDNFIVAPMGFLQKSISSIIGWFIQ